MTYRDAILGAFLCFVTFSASAETMEDVLRDVQWRADTSTMLAEVFAEPGPGEDFIRPLSRDEPVVRMVLQEANGEPLNGMVAVAAVALDRTAAPNWPSTMHEVIYQPGQFTGMSLPIKAYPLRDIRHARVAVHMAQRGQRPCGLAYWYHATWMAKPPAWAARLRRLCVIGQHAFYGFR